MNQASALRARELRPREAAWRRLLQAAALGAVVVWPLYADDDATVAAEQKIRQALQEPTQIDFSDTTLHDAMSFLSDLHKVNVRLDDKALEENGVGTDTPITAQLDGITLKSGLRLLLEPLKLTPVVHEGVLLITTEDRAQNMHEPRVYRVGDLLGDNREALLEVIQTSIARDGWSQVGGTGTLLLFDDLLVVTQTEQIHDELAELLSDLRAARPQVEAEAQAAKGPAPAADADGMVVRTYTLGGQGASDDFVDLIRTMVAAGSWSENGGQGSIRRVGPLQFADGATLGGALIVRQTPEVHAQLDRFLGQLKSIASPARIRGPIVGGGGMGAGPGAMRVIPGTPGGVFVPGGKGGRGMGAGPGAIPGVPGGPGGEVRPGGGGGKGGGSFRVGESPVDESDPFSDLNQ